MDRLDLALIHFEAYINNVADGHGPKLSMQGAPIDELLEFVWRLPQFNGKIFFFLIDEYENFLPYQQKVMNTLIKHSGHTYTFKVGVKELGWRRRSTIDEDAQLVSPADYALIDIGERLQGGRFNNFALRVCEERLARIRQDGTGEKVGIRGLLADMTEDEEAQRLGIGQAVAQVKRNLAREGINDTAILDQLDPLEIYLIDYWAKHEGHSVAEGFTDFVSNRSAWERRYGNYKHALLYTLRRGKPGIRKYYAGWATFTRVAGGNIRYLLQLVYESILDHFQEGESLSIPISPKRQTRAAQKVGRTNLGELEGLPCTALD